MAGSPFWSLGSWADRRPLQKQKQDKKYKIFYSDFTILSSLNIHFIYYSVIAQLFHFGNKDDIFRASSGFARQHAQVNIQTKNEYTGSWVRLLSGFRPIIRPKVIFKTQDCILEVILTVQAGVTGGVERGQLVSLLPLLGQHHGVPGHIASINPFFTFKGQN